MNKKCCDCKQIKELTEFYKDRSRKDGYACRCKPCSRKQRRELTHKYPDKYKAINAKNYQARQQLIESQRNKPCMDCGFYHPGCMQFHHRNPKEKSFKVTDTRYYHVSVDILLTEIAKCDVICANCHCIRHYNMKGKNHAWTPHREAEENG